ncbi:hypothetical protein C0993_011910 [Termitomyces sp. T159_Od127]|nr:hypothetical protein C0993_011910 [Termitomyces sp. T159_Od127]
MVVILMKHQGHTLQSAVDYVGDLCAQTIAGFEHDCERLPSWGPEIDPMVQKYVECLKSWIVGSVSNRPGSQTLEHAATNIKEEVGNSAADLAKVIAGANVKDDPLVPEGSTSFARGLPYMGASGVTVYLAHSAGMAASGLDTTLDPGVALTLLDQALNIQVTYGAVPSTGAWSLLGMEAIKGTNVYVLEQPPSSSHGPRSHCSP